MRFEFEKKKLWTTFEIIIINDDEEKVNKNIYQIWNMVDIFENKFSRFKNDSLISILNEKKELEFDSEFFDIYQKSKNLFELTNWFFNPLVNLNTIWYSKSFEKSDFLILNTEQNLNFNNILIDSWKIILQKNQNIDFWWIAKWYLVDKISKQLIENWFTDFLVNWWWDIFISWLNEEWNKWGISIESPYENESILGWVRLTNISISTSWSYRRKWNIRWERFHHILNPHTLKNDNELLGITIISQHCYYSDSLATAIFCMWIDEWKKIMIKNNIDWILFWKYKKIYITPNFNDKYMFLLNKNTP